MIRIRFIDKDNQQYAGITLTSSATDHLELAISASVDGRYLMDTIRTDRTICGRKEMHCPVRSNERVMGKEETKSTAQQN